MADRIAKTSTIRRELTNLWIVERARERKYYRPKTKNKDVEFKFSDVISFFSEHKMKFFFF
ncbi:hypothetical protein YC2023_007624 [Brassica napus]